MEDVNEKEKKKFPTVKVVLWIFLLVGIFMSYSHFLEPHFLRTKEIKIVNPKITDSFHGFKIVQLSDIHYGRTTKEKDFNKIQKEVNRLKADIIVFTGDLFENGMIFEEEDQTVLKNFLSGLEASIGKYAISGEEDISVSTYSILLEQSGFTLLDNTYDVIFNDKYESILLSGLSSSTDTSFTTQEKLSSTYDYFNQFAEEAQTIKSPIYRILLVHEPDIISELDSSNFDLILAGHTHLGQLRLPFIGGLCYPKNGKQYKNGYKKIGNTDLYISSGIGTTTIGFRFLNPPEINFYRLTNH